MSFSENLSRLMAEHEESNYRLAKELNVSQTTIANWKSGIRPLPPYMKMLSEHFGISIDELLGIDKTENNEKT